MVDTISLSKLLAGVVGLYPGFAAGSDQPAGYHREPVVYLSDAHKLLRPDILHDLGPNLAKIDYPAYSPTKTYFRYDVVKGNDGKLYENQVKGNLGHAVSESDYWQPTTALSAWYSRIERGAISKLALLLASGSVPLLDNQAIFSLEGNASDTINKQNRFVGWRIYVSGNDTALEVLKAALQLSGAVENFPLYLYHSTQDAPLTVLNLTGNTPGRSIWKDINETLYQRIGGYYLFGYYENDLPTNVFAIGANRSFAVGAACRSCGGGVDAYLLEGRSPFIAIEPVYIPNVSTPLTMDLAELSAVQVSSQTWGLNLVISAKSDATRPLIANKDNLVNALLYSIACDVLEEISTSDRVNATAKNMTNQAYIALNGQKDTDKGLKAERNKIIADTKATFSTISPATPPEKQRPGISIGSMWD
ncbi:hypothetical protein [Spirosoma sp. 48-14]|uniref:hypothetical protein n=1 Tax=Spirosoma sp. 48-14 TaxID=1895854 RepID=UPI00095FB291|nr:hypothetical protein [Spirosoma sp. 48-14]OJW78438.1 MAG: hypothetical protein BGO59_31030 [Spirosoma sp. 48-14]